MASICNWQVAKTYLHTSLKLTRNWIQPFGFIYDDHYQLL